MGYAPSSCRSGRCPAARSRSGRDLLARRASALAEQLPQPLARLRAAPPVLAHLADEMLPQLRGADPGAEVVGRVEAGVHVGEVVLRRIADARGAGEPLGVAAGRPAVVAEAAPELELELELRRVAAEEQRLEEDRCFGILVRLLVGEPEVLGVPARLSRDRFHDVAVDLGQRVVARQLAEGVRQPRVDAGVVERMPGLVQERLVVVEAALGARDQMDDVRRIGGDDARARGLLRPVVEVEPDPGRALDVEAQCCQRSRRTPGPPAPWCTSGRAETGGAGSSCGSRSEPPRARGREASRTSGRAGCRRRPRMRGWLRPAHARAPAARFPSRPRCVRPRRARRRARPRVPRRPPGARAGRR